MALAEGLTVNNLQRQVEGNSEIDIRDEWLI